MLKNEHSFLEQDVDVVGGIDEAGRGPLAGPVVAAAVILPRELNLAGLDDSKKLTPEERNRLFDIIGAGAVSVGIGVATAEEIDQINILEATRLAATRAVARLDPQPGFLVTDYLTLPVVSVPQLPLVKGDQRCRAVAAASVMAKVYRDRLMVAYDNEFPGYGFASHKGYGTRAHMEALRSQGPTTIHRITFNGVCWFSPTFRHSRTYDEIRRELAESADRANTMENCKKRLEDLEPFLPVREIMELRSLVAAFRDGI